MSMQRSLTLLRLCALAAFGLASVAMLAHALSVDRQADTQLVTYSFQLLQSIQGHLLSGFLLAARKYPLLPVDLFAITNALIVGLLLVTGSIHSLADVPRYLFTGGIGIQLADRFLLWLTALGTLILVYTIAERLYSREAGWNAVILLLTSFLFALYTTSLRPHMAVTFFITLTLWRSILLLDHRTRWNTFLAFASAVAAFAVLQNGLSAFLFPILAFIFSDKQGWRRKLVPVIGIAIVSIVIAVIIGYPFILHSLFTGQAVSFDLGHDYIAGQPKWTGEGFIVLLRTLLGSELFITVAGAIAFALYFRGKKSASEWMMWAFVVLTAVIFGLYTGTSPRMFLPMLPVLCILGAPVLTNYRWLSFVVMIFAIALQLKIAMLGFVPDTYDRARLFIANETHGSISTSFPAYYLGIPETKRSIIHPQSQRDLFIASQKDDLPGARDFVSPAAKADVIVMTEDQRIPDGFTLCQSISSSPTNPVFLWAEMDWPVTRLWMAKRWGPELQVFCKDTH